MARYSNAVWICDFGVFAGLLMALAFISSPQQSRGAAFSNALDPTYTPTAVQGSVHDFEVLADGKVVVAGDFIRERQLLVLNVDGSINRPFSENFPGGRSVEVDDLGNFYVINQGLYKYLPDGKLDTQFTPPGFLAGSEFDEMELLGHELVISGYFKFLTETNWMLFLNPDGTVKRRWSSPYRPWTSWIVPDGEGKYYLGFSGVGRSLSDGIEDPTFGPVNFDRCLPVGCYLASPQTMTWSDSYGRAVVSGQLTRLNHQWLPYGVGPVFRFSDSGQLERDFRPKLYTIGSVGTFAGGFFGISDDQFVVVEGDGDTERRVALAPDGKVYVADIKTFSGPPARRYMGFYNTNETPSVEMSIGHDAFTLVMAGGTTSNIVLQSSESLEGWNDLRTITNYKGFARITLPRDTNSSRMFIRIAQARNVDLSSLGNRSK